MRLLGGFVFEVNCLIGGRNCASSDGAVAERRNPISGEVATRYAAATVADAREAANAAAAAFPGWAALGPSDRRGRLLKAADVLEARIAEFQAVVMSETGATAGWVHFNVRLAAGMLREAAAMATQIVGEIIPSDVPESMSLAIRQPAGVVLGIAPWNAPIILGVRALAMPLACGNTVILKASEICPGTHRLIGTVLQDAGVGEGVVNVITHAPQDAGAIVESLISHQAVRRINFTGSTRVGRAIAQTAAKHFKPILLELGGKAPIVVLDDADIEAAVNATVFGAFANSGQICMSTERVIIDASIADEFSAKLAQRAAALLAGDPQHGDFVLGAVFDQSTVERVQRLVDDAVRQGAKVLVQGPIRGNLMGPVVVDHVTPELAIFREESFGPQVSITRVANVDEAVRLANDTEYGLSAAVFGRNIARALDVAKRIESGICHVNGPTVHDEAQVPFGGTKASGYGRFGGKASISEFTELRWITVQLGPRHYPF
jgi:vanillin dehydrogenase